jgi:two-component system, NtrC family, sensor kinase
MPSEFSIAGTDHDREPAVEELRRELAEAREQHVAAAAVLAAMSNSPTDPHQVFAEIAAGAARHCGADNAAITQLRDGCLRLVADYGALPATGPVGQAQLPLARGLTIGRAIIDKQTIHVADLQAETNNYPEGSEIARRLGHRSVLVVPLMRGGEAIGAITIRRNRVCPFTSRQIALLKTFADQAVIAMENTRLFEAEQASKRELTEALEYQTATSDVLEAISRSPTDSQPVFDIIAKSAARLCAAQFCHVFRFDVELIHFVASHGHSAKVLEAAPSYYPMHPGRGSVLNLSGSSRRDQ